MNLSKKRILIISPQEWSHIKVSKHHYALELSKLGNEVVFLNPPSKTENFVSFKREKINDNLSVLHNSLSFPYRLRFHFISLFNFLINFHIKKVIKQLGKFDVVWSFSPLYPNLSKFGGDMIIYHAVDNVKEIGFITPAKHCDVLLGVTPLILSRFNKEPKYLINHGLSSAFLLPEYEENVGKNNSGRIRVCYSGNLNIPAIDRGLIISLVKTHHEVEFNFYGSYDRHETDSGDFIKELEASENVVLHGKLETTDLAKAYIGMDVFLLCYNKTSTYVQNRNQSTNSHKMLEYLATGKVVVSTLISAYEGNHLIEMTTRDENDQFPELFQKVISHLEDYNSPELIKERISFARKNSYVSRIKEIENLLSNL